MTTTGTRTQTLTEVTPYRFELPTTGAMRVPGVVFVSRELLPTEGGGDSGADQALGQVTNVATLPGIVEASYAMPDLHWGYGFPIGGVAATAVDPVDTVDSVGEPGVVSPGGVGFDISCGVRLLAADTDRAGLSAATLARVMDRLDHAIPRGAGRGAVWSLPGRGELDGLLRGGSRYCVEQGHGVDRDLLRCEDGGAVADADPGAVSARAVDRGLGQVGSLGSGNHFLEVQVVSEVYDETAAAAYGLAADQVCVMIHCGSRGLGHQICTDHVRVMERAMARYGIRVPDRQLACAPVRSPEGEAYLGAMAAAANYGRANRQLLGEAVRRVFDQVAGVGLDLVYDVSHNLAKLERHPVTDRGGGTGDGAASGTGDGGATVRDRLLCVHRKGATRALPPGHPDLPADLAAAGVGQPVLVPGSMMTSSYVLSGVAGSAAFHSTCHGAGRVWSRHQAARAVRGRELRDRMTRAGIEVRGASMRGLAEETPQAYKDVDEVVVASVGAGLCRLVARLEPLGVVKG